MFRQMSLTVIAARLSRAARTPRSTGFYGTLWVVLADVHQTGGSYTVMEQCTRAARRELPPQDLALPSEDVLTAHEQQLLSASSDSGWSTIAPQP